MSKTAVTVLIVLAAAGAGAATTLWLAPPDLGPAASEPLPSSFDSSAPVAERLHALEAALEVERQARQLLQEEVIVLTETLDTFRLQEPVTSISAAAEGTAESSETAATERQDRRSRAERRAERRNARLLASGFTESEVEWILRRESELQMETLQSRYAARRAGESTSGFGRGASQTALREELGDANYERYLEASGRPTRVAISSVFEGSPALAAGLRPGDEIVSYDGQRVFGMDEITSLTLSGNVGEPVSVDLMRDGILMQVSMPRGPLGVVGGRRFRR